MHAHAGAEIALLFSGRVQTDWKANESIVGPNTVAFMPPERAHASNYLTPVHAFYIAIRTSAWQRLEAHVANLTSVLEFHHGVELQLAKRMHEEYQQNDDFSELMLEGLMLQLTATMARKSERVETGAIPKWLLKAQEFLHAHATHPINLSTIANVAGVHPGHLMRSFQQHFGETVGDYMRKLRVEIACRRIANLNADESLGHLAADLGYSDQGQFTRTFKKVMGQTPKQYRNSCRL